MLNKTNRLRKNKEYSYVYKKGKRISHAFFTIYYVPTKFSVSRIGISVSAKVGKSYVRSRVKRVLSEICRLNISKIKTNNYVIVPRDTIVAQSYAQVEKAFVDTLTKANLWC